MSADQRERNPVVKSVTFTKRTAFLFVILLTFAFVTAAVGQGPEPADTPGGEETEPEWVILKEEILPYGVQTTATIIASKDAFISSRYPNSNFGGNTTSGLGYYAGVYDAMRIIIQFDINSIPSSAIINSATLDSYLHSSRPSNDGPMAFKAQHMKSSWSEYSVTWNNANYLGGSEIGVREITSQLGWRSTDVTQLVKQWHNGTQVNYGFIMTGDEAPERNHDRFFRSRQYGGYEPRLYVNYTQCSDLTPPAAYANPLPAWSGSSINVSWYGNDNAAGIAYYDVDYNLNGGSWTRWLTNTTNQSATFNGAQNGQQYQFRVRAIDNCGNTGAWGPTVFTNVDTIAPTASMQALNPYTFGSSFIVYWDGTDNPGGSGIASYDVQFRINGGSWTSWINNTSAKSAQVTGGQQGDVYEFQARARDVAGNTQGFTNVPQATTTIVLHSVAIVNKFLSPPITDQLSFNVSWSGFSAPGVTINFYDLQYRFNGGAWTTWDSFDTTSALFDLVDPDVDGIYEFEARARNSLNQTESFTGTPEAMIVVDRHAPFIEISGFFPIVANTAD